MSSARTLLVPVDALPELSVNEWRHDLAATLRAGGRVVTMFGKSNDDRVVVTAIVERVSELTPLRTVVERDVGYHSLTPEFPSLHSFERELHEQADLRVVGHPWLKPIRFERSGPKGRDGYPFYEIRGKEVHEVAVGPIHAGVIEPGSFRFMCHGEQVRHLEIHLGYQHRGVEKLLLARAPDKLAPLVETIAGDTSIAHTWAYATALEALADKAVPYEIDAARGVMLELERVGMHLSTLAGLAADVGFLQGASTYGRLRTTAIHTSMRLSGSRFGRGAIRPLGIGVKLESRPDLPATANSAFTTADLRRHLKLLSDDTAIIDDRFLSSATVQHRLMGVGTLSSALAREIGLVGVAARASDVPCDLRAGAGGVYEHHPIETVVEPAGDCWARARVRIGEVARSLAWLGSVTDALSPWNSTQARVGSLLPRHLVVSMIEGFRGEVVHALETDSAGRLTHYKVQDPSFRNWLGLALAVRENEISDFPICNKSFDLSYCGSDL